MKALRVRAGSGRRKHMSSKTNGSAHKLQEAARLATLEARKENKAFGVETLVAKADGLYLYSNSSKPKRIKKGNYKPIRLRRRLIDIGK
ncbi:MAG: hypothetical protein MUQ00_04070 [Candidatus Aminicenantes bacterium]|nr:hypothetical protein [Candidatus Aminicenantes bacterium]